MSRVTVLHVDDDERYLDLTRRTVESEYDDVSVRSTVDPADVPELLEDADCVVSDYQMGETTGVNVFEAVRERDPDVPFLLFTGKGSEEVAEEALRAGVTDYVRKNRGPDQFDVLVRRVRNAVDARRKLERREEELGEERNRFSALFENIPEATVEYELDATGEPYVTDVNPAFETVFGYDRENVVGERLDDFIVSEDRQEEAAHLNEKVARGESLDAEVCRETATGERQFLLRDVPLGFDGMRHGYAIYTDITDQRERETQLRRSRERLERQNERLEAFAGVVSHDLRNPLSVAYTNADLAIEMGDVERVEAIRDALDRMDELIQDLLALAQHGTAVQELTLCPLGEVAVRAWNAVDTADATLDARADTAVRADESRLQQLFENLFRNAVEHGSTSPASQAQQDAVEHGSTNPQSTSGDAVEHGSTSPASQAQQDAVEHGPTDVTVTVTDLEDGFAVADDGPGVDESVVDCVFDHGVTTASRGSGYGLAIVESIADAHDWTVELVDADGARFEVTGVDVIR